MVCLKESFSRPKWIAKCTPPVFVPTIFLGSRPSSRVSIGNQWEASKPSHSSFLYGHLLFWLFLHQGSFHDVALHQVYAKVFGFFQHYPSSEAFRFTSLGLTRSDFFLQSGADMTIAFHLQTLKGGNLESYVHYAWLARKSWTPWTVSPRACLRRNCK